MAVLLVAEGRSSLILGRTDRLFIGLVVGKLLGLRHLTGLDQGAVLLVHEARVGLQGLLLHQEIGQRVENILVLLRIRHTEHIAAEDARRRVELLVFHLEEAFAADALIRPFDRSDGGTEDWQAHVLADQVGVWPQFDQVSMGVAFAELTDETLLDDLLVVSLVVGDLQPRLLGDGGAGPGEGDLRRGDVLLVHLGRCRHVRRRDLL